MDACRWAAAKTFWNSRATPTAATPERPVLSWASRITRVVDDLQKRGLVRKERCAGDARGNVATLTGDGLALKAAYPGHLASACLNLIGHVDTASTAALNGNVTAAARPIQ